MEVFLKRAENPFRDKIGEEKTQTFFDELKNGLYLLPGEFSDSLGTEIPRFLFKCSQGLNQLSNETIEGILQHFVVFTKSLNDLSNQNIKQINQNLINRSNSAVRNLSDLLEAFINKARDGEFLNNSESHNDIINFTIGESAKITQFEEFELFITRSADNFTEKIGKDKAKEFSDNVNKSLKNIAEEFKGTADSEVAKYVFKFSEDTFRFKSEILENVLKHISIFSQSLSNMGGMNRKQVDQEITKRSKNKLSGLIDLFKEFIEMAKEGKLLTDFQNFEDVITHVIGSKEKRKQFTDVGGFLKRAEEKYVKQLGELKAQKLIDDLLKAISEIPEEHGSYLGSDIARYLTKYSEIMNDLESKEIEKILTRSLMFTHSLNDLGDLNQEEINQYVINRSKRTCRNLFELYKLFLEIERPTSIKSRTPTFDDIVNYTLGKYEGPKSIEEAPNVHTLIEEYRLESPVFEEHFKWANAINNIVPRFLEILENEEGNRIFDQLWENSFPKQKIIEDFHQKIDELPREDDKLFTIRLMNLLTRQIIKNKKSDKLLTGSVAIMILAKIFIEIYSGRNSMVRGIKLKQLLKEREFAIDDKKEKLNEQVLAIVQEDLKAIMRRVLTIRSIIPILTLKGYYIKTFDISKKDYPELFVDMFEDVSPLNDIGKEYLDYIRRLNTLGNLSALYYYIDLVRNFYKNYFKESEETPLDAVKNRDLLIDFFKMLFQLYDNLELTRFYDNKITIADRLVFIYILKYLYEPLQKTFDLIENFLEEHKEFIKVKSLEFFLSKLKRREYKMNIEQLHEDIKSTVSEGESDDSEKMERLKSMLDQQKSDMLKFSLMDELVIEANKCMPILDARIFFSKELLTFLEIIKHINPNLPAIFPSYFENIGDFTNEFNKVLELVRELKEKNLISPGEFYDIDKAREISTERLTKFVSDQKFIDHIERMREGYDKNILYKEELMAPLPVEQTDEVIEEFNPLEKYFQKYHEALTAVKSTETLTKFMESFQFWTNNQILPVTYNKAEEVLLKIVFNDIQEEMDNIE